MRTHLATSIIIILAVASSVLVNPLVAQDRGFDDSVSPREYIASTSVGFGLQQPSNNNRRDTVQDLGDIASLPSTKLLQDAPVGFVPRDGDVGGRSGNPAVRAGTPTNGYRTASSEAAYIESRNSPRRDLNRNNLGNSNTTYRPSISRQTQVPNYQGTFNTSNTAASGGSGSRQSYPYPAGSNSSSSYATRNQTGFSSNGGFSNNPGFQGNRGFGSGQATVATSSTINRSTLQTGNLGRNSTTDSKQNPFRQTSFNSRATGGQAATGGQTSTGFGSTSNAAELANRQAAAAPQSLANQQAAAQQAATQQTAFRQAANQAPSLGGSAPRVAQNNNCNCAPNYGYQAPAGYQAPGYQVPAVTGTTTNFQVPTAQAPQGFYQPGAQYQQQCCNPNTGGGVFGGQRGGFLSGLLSGTGRYTPLIGLERWSQGTYLGQGIIGQPTAYVSGQPLRNFMRYLFP